MCRWCHEPCGDREFCSDECYEGWLEAQAEVPAGAEDPGEEREHSRPHEARAA